MENTLDMTLKNRRDIASPTGSDLTCRSWTIEAPFRMLQNNLAVSYTHLTLPTTPYV